MFILHNIASIAIYTRHQKWRGLLAAYSTLHRILYLYQCYDIRLAYRGLAVLAAYKYKTVVILHAY
jgi:hypothetical protein